MPIHKRYQCPECEEIADFRFLGEIRTLEGKIVGSRFQCFHGHRWVVEGWSAMDVIMDPEAEPCYDLSRERSEASGLKERIK